MQPAAVIEGLSTISQTGNIYRYPYPDGPVADLTMTVCDLSAKLFGRT